MTYALTAAQCPAPQFRSAFLSVSAGTPPVSAALASGDLPSAIIAKTRANAVRQDLAAAFGSGPGFFVAQGLTLSAGSGLNVAVAAGLANVGGYVAVETATTLGLTGSLTNAFIWISSAGVLSYTTSATPPAGAQCLLGNVTTSGSAVSGVDYSGVLYKLGDRLVRFTGDAGKPADTPSSNFHFRTVTSGGVYDWAGTFYMTMPPS